MNYIMICLDSLKQDHIGAYGATECRTPNLDRFAEQSAVFTRARSEALPTVPVRRALQTGIRTFPWEDIPKPKGIYNRHAGWCPIPQRQTTLAEHLAERGYVTGMVIDVYHLMKPSMNFHRGMKSFEFIRGQENDQWKAAPLPEGALDRYVPDGCPERRLRVFTQYMQNQQGRPEGEIGHQVARVMTAAANWLEGMAGAGDFYLWVDSFDPHEPWDVPPEYIDMYAPGYEGKRWIYPNVIRYEDMTEPEIEHAKACYKAEVTLVDRWFGHLIDTIEELGLFENSLVVLLSDHGKIVGDRSNFGMSNKDTSRHLYDVPLMVRHPDGIGVGRRFDQWVYDIDVTATALDALGEEPLPQMDGRSFLPIMTGDVERLHDYAVCGYSEVHCVWQDDFVLVRDDEEGTEELFDAWQDKDQTTDLSGEMPDLTAELSARLDELVEAGHH